MDGSDLSPLAPIRDDLGRFAPGNPGRPFGSRNRVSKRVARAILRDFESNQAELLPRLRKWFLPQYVSLVGRLMPRLAEEGADIEAVGDAEASALVEALRAALARIDAGQGSLADLEAALLGENIEAGAVTIGDLR
jgi:hypothetical protein